mgnify:CR=1 FL=1
MRTYQENGCDCQNCYYQYFENNNFQKPKCYQEHEIYRWKNSKVWRMNRNEDNSLTIAGDCKDYLYIGDVEE